MNRKLFMRKTEEKCGCNGCSAKNYDNQLGKSVDVIYEIEVGSLSVHLCPSCLSSLVSLSYPFLKEKEKEEGKRVEKEYEAMFQKKNAANKQKPEERKTRAEKREEILETIIRPEEERSREDLDGKYQEAIKN